MISERLKESIIVEKLTTEITYRALAAKYNLKRPMTPKLNII
jgi:hypothetical protein